MKNYIAIIFLSWYIKSRPHQERPTVKKKFKKLVDTMMSCMLK